MSLSQKGLIISAIISIVLSGINVVLIHLLLKPKNFSDLDGAQVFFVVFLICITVALYGWMIFMIIDIDEKRDDETFNMSMEFYSLCRKYAYEGKGWIILYLVWNCIIFIVIHSTFGLYFVMYVSYHVLMIVFMTFNVYRWNKWIRHTRYEAL